jgi:hypothetical protein
VPLYSQKFASFSSRYLQHFASKLMGSVVICPGYVEGVQTSNNYEGLLARSVLARQRCRPFQGIAHLRRRVT